MSNDKTLVLVTGANGFVASHCILQLLKAGYRVRGTVRSTEGGKKVKDIISAHTDTPDDRLSFAQADLSNDAGWERAVSGCSFILHVASPVPRQAAKHPDDVIVPAREGTLRVLKAAAKGGVKRVVMTSSTAAVLWGNPRDGSKVYDERDWSTLTKEVAPYERSKTLAERAAWDYVGTLSGSQRFEFVTLNPGLVLGPVLGNNASVSGEVVRKLLAGEFPGCPDLGFAAVDVRDVAAAHLTAMTHPEAPNQRFILAIEHASLLQIAQILDRHFGPKGFKVPARRLPSWILKIVALFDKTAALVVPELGKRQDVSSQRAQEVLSWKPRDLETMVVAMGESMLAHGIVKPQRSPRAALPSATESARG
jgi:nucleoside-diphosphate-sugar epimerase